MNDGRHARLGTHGIAARLAAPVLAALALLAAPAAADPSPEDVRLVSEPVVRGIELPTALAQTPGGTFLIGTKSGRVLAWDPVAGGEPRLAVDLSSSGLDDVQWDADRGLLGIAADPGFDDSGSPGHRRVYLSYQSRRAPPDATGNRILQPSQGCTFDCPSTGRLVAAVVPETGMAADVQVVAENWCSEMPFHGMGDLQWSADGGELYVSAGDGIISTDDPATWTWSGNPCRDPDGRGGSWRAQHAFMGIPDRGWEGSIVAIPLADLRDPDGDAGGARTVAAGFRNPWRLALDDATGDLFAANVGWFTHEEVERIPAADVAGPAVTNHGWPCTEGPAGFGYAPYAADPYCLGLVGGGGLRPPWIHYSDADGPAAVQACAPGLSVGPLATVHADRPLPIGLGSGLFLADVVRGCGWIVNGRDADGSLRPDSLVRVPARFEAIVDAVQAADGDIHWLRLYGDDWAGPGSLNRLRTGVVADIDVIHAPSPGAVARLSAAGTQSSLDDPGLVFDWDLDGDGTFGDAAGRDVTVAVDGPREVTVRATDRLGRSHDASATVRVGTAPTVAIRLEPGSTVAPDTVVRATVDVSDPDDDASAADTMWTVEIQHCPTNCHTHPILNRAGSEIEFAAEPHGTTNDSHYRIVARNTDRAGLVGTAAAEVWLGDPDDPGRPETETAPDGPSQDQDVPRGTSPRPAPSAIGPAQVTVTRAANGRASLRYTRRLTLRTAERHTVILRDARTHRRVAQMAGGSVGRHRLGPGTAPTVAIWPSDLRFSGSARVVLQTRIPMSARHRRAANLELVLVRRTVTGPVVTVLR